ncbi:hypothetical protein, partial [Candidatus Darwinibacter acetoxidans]
GRFMVLPNQPFQLLPFRVIQVFSFSSSGTMNVAHGSSLNNDLVLHPYIVSESRELFFHLILQVAQTPALTQHWLSSCFCPPGRARGALWFEIRTKGPRPELDRGSFRLQHTPPRSGIVLPWKSHIDKQGIPEYDNFTTIFQRYKPHGI